MENTAFLLPVVREKWIVAFDFGSGSAPGRSLGVRRLGRVAAAPYARLERHTPRQYRASRREQHHTLGQRTCCIRRASTGHGLEKKNRKQGHVT
eukprot:949377-Rhodomonas_salina.1